MQRRQRGLLARFYSSCNFYESHLLSQLPQAPDLCYKWIKTAVQAILTLHLWESEDLT